ncbi:MAG TPA: tetratricopeptide repeat protein [Allosphingosinicella sp.]
MIVAPLLAAFGFAFALSNASTPDASAEAVAMLDPSRLAESMCGGKAHAERSRSAWAKRARIAAASAMPEMPAPIRLQDGLGDSGFRITTSNAQARAWFNQGLMLAYGFNHDAAIKAFREAQQLDPGCAACFWGEAYALGPNINLPMQASANAPAWAAARRALALKAGASPEEQALIDALAVRYAEVAPADRSGLDRAFATAMLDAAGRFPGNDTIAAVAAEAEMDTRPWDYWESDRRTPKGRIGEATALIERVLARTPDHAQAIHLYIHLMENTAFPEKAEAGADRLARPLAPAAGHLVHMPGHLYYRLGRFRDSIRVNVDAARADEAWLAASGDKGFYRYLYYPHNVHFIMTSAQMGGDPVTAIREAKRMRAVMSNDVTAATPPLEALDASPFLAYAQFAAPRRVLALKAPDPRLAYATGIWRYARATAYARLRDDAGFNREIGALSRIRTGHDFKRMTDMMVPAPDLLTIAEKVARARRDYARGRYASAASLYREAAAIEDRINYMEPPYWYYPVRQSLGAALYRAGDLPGARQAFVEALAQYPGNGWALYGLAETHRALGDELSEKAARAAFQRAWLGDPRWIGMDRL